MIRKTVTMSSDGVYRYRLGRTWGDGAPCCFIMLNPSTADDLIDDPTIRRCIGFAKSWGFDGLDVVNLFALRATDPRTLVRHPHPVGPTNDEAIKAAVSTAGLVVAAWGNHGDILARSTHVRRFLPRGVKCFGHTRTIFEPLHPLYIRADAPLVSLSPEEGYG